MKAKIPQTCADSTFCPGRRAALGFVALGFVLPSLQGCFGVAVAGATRCGAGMGVRSGRGRQRVAVSAALSLNSRRSQSSIRRFS